jgi:hypothetical protein
MMVVCERVRHRLCTPGTRRWWPSWDPGDDGLLCSTFPRCWRRLRMRCLPPRRSPRSRLLSPQAREERASSTTATGHSSRSWLEVASCRGTRRLGSSSMVLTIWSGERGGAESCLDRIRRARRVNQPAFMLENPSSFSLDAIKSVEKMVGQGDGERRCGAIFARHLALFK